MNLDDYIARLQAIRASHGNLEVETTDYGAARIPAPSPIVDYKAILKGRETKPRFVSSYCTREVPERKGDPVCKV